MARKLTAKCSVQLQKPTDVKLLAYLSFLFHVPIFFVKLYVCSWVLNITNVFAVTNHHKFILQIGEKDGINNYNSALYKTHLG